MSRRCVLVLNWHMFLSLHEMCSYVFKQSLCPNLLSHSCNFCEVFNKYSQNTLISIKVFVGNDVYNNSEHELVTQLKELQRRRKKAACDTLTRQTDREKERENPQLNLHPRSLRFHSSVLATQTRISKCHLPCVSSVQPVSNQSWIQKKM